MGHYEIFKASSIWLLDGLSNTGVCYRQIQYQYFSLRTMSICVRRMLKIDKKEPRTDTIWGKKGSVAWYASCA